MALPLAVFFTVTSEMAPAGSVHHIARAFDQSLGDAALGSTLYALTTAILAVPLALLLQGFYLRRAVVCAGVGFAAATVATALAPSFSAYLFFRGLNGALHGALFPLALALAARASVSRPEQAVARVLLGNACALAIGVPFAEYFAMVSWRVPLTCAGAGIGIVIWFAPRDLQASACVPAYDDDGRYGSPDSGPSEVRPFLPVLILGIVFAVTLTGHFAFYTILGPWAEAENQSPAVLLACYGAAAIVATSLSDRAAQRSRIERAAFIVCVEAAVIASMPVLPAFPFGVCASIATGLCFGLLPTLVQTEMLDRAAGAGTIATSVAVVAFNIAIAAGSAGGAFVWGYDTMGPFILAATVLAFSGSMYVVLAKALAINLVE